MIKQSDKDTLNKYAQIKKDIKALEAMADEINPEVMEIMEMASVEEIEVSDIGKLSLGSRRTWKYSDQITEKEEEIKAIKKEAEQTGIGASYIEKKYVIFKANKE